MGVARSFGVLAAGIAWRSTGAAAAGRVLMRALQGDEQERTLAGMALVQAGNRSVPLMELAVDADGATTLMVRVLADIGGEEALRVMARIGEGGGEVAELARELMKTDS